MSLIGPARPRMTIPVVACLSFLLASVTLLYFASGRGAEQASVQDLHPIVSQTSIADIACGPCSLFNWLSHGDERLQGVLRELSDERTPVQTVKHIITEYGMRESATRPSVSRYGQHNGGVGSVNLMLMAREVLNEHSESPPKLRGEYLQKGDDEIPEKHLTRVVDWFSRSIRSGVPVLLYVRGYRRSAGQAEPQVTFGHHVVVTSIAQPPDSHDVARIGIEVIDPATGTRDKGFLSVAAKEFTAPTYTYRFRDERAVQTKSVVTGRPLLEVQLPHSSRSSQQIVTAHFATFADPVD